MSISSVFTPPIIIIMSPDAIPARYAGPPGVDDITTSPEDEAYDPVG